MATSKSRLVASVLRITSNPRVRRVAATSSASFLGLKRARSEFLYLELPMTSATRRSAHAALAASTIRRAPHKAAMHDEMGLFILNSGCSTSQFICIILSENVHAGLLVTDPQSYGGQGRLRPASSRGYGNPNRFGIEGGLMCDVIFVTEDKLERMLSEGERNLRLGLPRTKMQVIE